MTVLETQRLQLDLFNYEDAPFLFELVNSPGWLANIGDRNVRNIEDAKAYIDNRILPSYQAHNFGFYVMKIKASQQRIGTCGLVKRDHLEHIDIGYALLPDYFGQGYALEAAKAVQAFAKSKLNISTLAAITIAANKPSIRLLEKLGFQFKKTVKWPDSKEELMLFEG